jgi:hypothetical protein
MGLLARSLLVRLLARRGDPEAWRVAATLPAASSVPDPSIAGAVAAARLELEWLTDTLDGVPAEVADTVARARGCGHTTTLGELAAYLRRAGLPSPDVATLPGPWAASVAGRVHEAAAAWARLGDRYEQAVELASAPDASATEEGLRTLAGLGARATVRALSTQRTSSSSRIRTLRNETTS